MVYLCTSTLNFLFHQRSAFIFIIASNNRNLNIVLIVIHKQPCSISKFYTNFFRTKPLLICQG